MAIVSTIVAYGVLRASVLRQRDTSPTAPPARDVPRAPVTSPAVRRAARGDENRVFILVANLYPAVLGTILWQFIADPPNDRVTWIAALLIATHFSLDLLYLKINLTDNVGSRSFRYGWALFMVDVAIVLLIRASFATIERLSPGAQGSYASPISYFFAIYVLYVLWELLYVRGHGGLKETPVASVITYSILAVWFAICAAMSIFSARAVPDGPWEAIALIGFLAGLVTACAELYWSLFIADRETDRCEAIDR